MTQQEERDDATGFFSRISKFRSTLTLRLRSEKNGEESLGENDGERAWERMMVGEKDWRGGGERESDFIV